MITSQKNSSLSSPADDVRVPEGTFVYFRERNRYRIFEVLLAEFLKSGISQATLARRLGRRPEVVNRILSAPGNPTLDTISDFMFAMSGAEIAYSVEYPLNQPPRNYRHPDWLSHTKTWTEGVSLASDWQDAQRTATGGTITRSEIRQDG
jgi:hypothetical protein